MPDITSITSQRLHIADTTGEGARQGYSTVALHTGIISFIMVLGFCLTLKFPNVSPYETAYGTVMMHLFVIEICFYIVSLVVMAIQAARNNADLEDLMNKISLLFGTLALNIELLILSFPFGLIVISFWAIYLLCFVIKSYQGLKKLYQSAVAHLVQDFGELKQKLVDLNRRLMGSNAIAALGGTYQTLKDLIIRNDRA